MATGSLCILTRFGNRCPYTHADPAAAPFPLTTDAAVNRENDFRFPDTRAALVSVPLWFSRMNRVTERWERDGRYRRFSPLLVDECRPSWVYSFS